MSKWLGKILARQPAGGGGGQWYAATTGNSGNSGAIGSPWDLQTGLNGGSAGQIQPNDTLNLRAGTYTGAYTTSVAGTSGHPVTVRSYPGEAAILDGNPHSGNPPGVLQVGGSYVWFRDLEIRNSVAAPPEFGMDGVNAVAGSFAGVKVINCVIHDNTAAGIGGVINLVTDFEAYGNVLYFNGRSPAPITVPPENAKFDYGMYLANNSGIKYITKNILVHNMGNFQIQCYSQTAGNLNGFTFTGNTMTTHRYMTLFSRGWFWAGSASADLQNFTFDRNYVMAPDNGEGTILINSDGVNDAISPTITNNMLGQGIVWIGNFNSPWHVSGLTFTGNSVYGDIPYGFGFTPGAFPTNDWHVSDTIPNPLTPASNWVAVESNAYEAGRANLTCFNWTNASSQNFDVSSVLSVGDNWSVVKAEDYFGTPVATGTNYAGGNISVSLTNTTVTTGYGFAAGRSQPTSTMPLLGAFLLRKV